MSYISQAAKIQSQFQEKKPEYYIPQSSAIPNPFSKSQISRERSANNSQQVYEQSVNQSSQYYISSPHIQDSNQRASSLNRLVSSQVTNQQIVKGESRIKYVPYEKKIFQFQNRSYIQKVPIKRKVIQFQQRRVMESVPHEVVQKDYYAIQRRVQYYKEVIPERRVEMVPVQRKIKKYEYVPVEKQIIHYPRNYEFTNPQRQSRVQLQSQGVYVKPDAQFRPINSNLLYNYSAKPEGKYQPIGYFDQGQSRVFSNAPTYLASSFVQNGQGSLVYGYNQPIVSRSHSANRLGSIPGQKFTDSRVRPQLYQQNQSYIKQLSKMNNSNIKKPFQMLDKSNVERYDPKVKQEQSIINIKSLYDDYYKYQDPTKQSLNSKLTDN